MRDLPKLTKLSRGSRTECSEYSIHVRGVPPECMSLLGVIKTASQRMQMSSFLLSLGARIMKSSRDDCLV